MLPYTIMDACSTSVEYHSNKAKSTHGALRGSIVHDSLSESIPVASVLSTHMKCGRRLSRRRSNSKPNQKNWWRNVISN
jgi:hypothetical protein